MKYLTTLISALYFYSLTAQPLSMSFHGAASLSAGGSYVTLTGISALINNPAGLSDLSYPGWYLGAENRFELPVLTAFQAGVAIPTDSYGCFGGSLVQFGTSGFSDRRVSLVYARRLLPKLSLGAGLDWLHTRIKAYDGSHHFTIQIGLISRINRELTWGLHLYSPHLPSISTSRYIPAVMAFGLVYSPSGNLLIRAEIEKSSRHGARFKSSIHFNLPKGPGFSLGIQAGNGAAVVSTGLFYFFKDRYRMDLGLNFHQLLGISSGIAIELSMPRA